MFLLLSLLLFDPFILLSYHIVYDKWDTKFLLFLFLLYRRMKNSYGIAFLMVSDFKIAMVSVRVPFLPKKTVNTPFLRSTPTTCPRPKFLRSIDQPQTKPGRRRHLLLRKNPSEGLPADGRKSGMAAPDCCPNSLRTAKPAPFWHGCRQHRKAALPPPSPPPDQSWTFRLRCDRGKRHRCSQAG